MNKKIILIGGAPTTGKSTLAQQVARHFDLPWVSTDQIRNTMRVTASRQDYPNLFNPKGYSAERLLTEFSAEEIVDIEFRQSEAAWLGISAFIKNDYRWTNGFVVEGINVLPHLVRQDFADNDGIRAAFLVDRDEARTRKVIYERGLCDDVDKYPDSAKEKEVEWVTLFCHSLEREAAHYGYPVIDVDKTNDDLARLISVLKL
ncbi:hypothetical protein [Mycolicibacterium goodii]|uniref:hypothetical protein n=1 Tax=Mycolicibacterium goodii TaxID=134601 RepID=UPI001BDCC79F|nr:hypothetical protein [Mycolicibacterium goodii]MBU8830557.1 hypothetical protein [Mycolicibacterium goodii]